MADRALTVLVIEDDESLRRALALTLSAKGYTVVEKADAQAALIALERARFDMVLCDLKLPGMDGLSFIRAAKEAAPSTPVIIMTGGGSYENGIEALRVGAYDYLQKPFEMEELLFQLHKLEEREQLRSENASLKAAFDRTASFENIVAKSPSMMALLELVKRVADFSSSVLISGESGTGKELIARAIHLLSPRKSAPFIAINCAAIPESLIESELFGHRKGAFTDASHDRKGLFEEAHGGTIFLDEIGDLPIPLQVKLLRVLQEKVIRRLGDECEIPLDVRVISASHKNIEAEVRTGHFREDLFYRLNVVPLAIPPLRDRLEDVPLLVEHFLKRSQKKHHGTPREISAEALRALLSYRWPGNVRELENCLERAVVMATTGTVQLSDLPSEISSVGTPPSVINLTDETNLSIKQHTETLERELIVRALKKTGGNRTHAAKLLELSHRALLYKLKEYQIS